MRSALNRMYARVIQSDDIGEFAQREAFAQASDPERVLLWVGHETRPLAEWFCLESNTRVSTVLVSLRLTSKRSRMEAS